MYSILPWCVKYERNSKPEDGNRSRFALSFRVLSGRTKLCACIIDGCIPTEQITIRPWPSNSSVSGPAVFATVSAAFLLSVRVVRAAISLRIRITPDVGATQSLMVAIRYASLPNLGYVILQPNEIGLRRVHII